MPLVSPCVANIAWVSSEALDARGESTAMKILRIDRGLQDGGLVETWEEAQLGRGGGRGRRLAGI